jgi:midasin (ATPase involved in ribosome maturation)
VSLNGSTGVEEIIGKWLAKDGSTYWLDGILVNAMKKGYWIVFDEINSALPEILFTLHSLLDDEKKVMLAEKDNEIVVPHEDFRLFATMNPSEDYAGTKDMNKALLSRFNAIINIHTLSNEHEEQVIISQAGCDPKDATILVRLADALRKLKKDDKLFYYCSTRDLVQTAKLIAGGISMSDALVVAVLNKMSTEEAESGDVTKSVSQYITIPKHAVVTYQEMMNTHEAILAENQNLKNDNELKANQIAELSTEMIKKISEMFSKDK